MSAPISDRLFLCYLHCKYKAYLKLSGKSGIKGDYEKLLDDQNASYRRFAHEHFQQSNQKIASPEVISLFKDIQKQKPEFTTRISIVNDRHDLILDAVELASKPSSRKPVYQPIIYLPHQIITKKDKLLLAFCCSALTHEQKAEIDSGKSIIGNKFSTSKVRLSSLINVTEKLEKEIRIMMDTQTVPPLRLNDHCKICEFQGSCLTVAKEKDDLSLLSTLKEKEIEKLQYIGIFTILQYSYRFRPRRKRKGAKKYSKKHYAELQALSIRNKKIYVYERPQLPVNNNTQIFVDVEGDPFRNYYYLIGVVIVENSLEKQYSFWADDENGENDIFMQFIHLLKKYSDFDLYHYGSYEIKFLKKMQNKLEGYMSEGIDKIRNKSINILTKIYGNIYFPTYSYKLKDIGSYLGFRWTEEQASGLQSVVWRKDWDQDQNDGFKQKLIQYNLEDCLALKKITDVLYNISIKDNTEDNEGESPVFVCEQESIDEHSPRKWGNTVFCSSDFDYINRCAYFDYQKEKIFFRTNKNTLQVLKKEKKHEKISGKINKYVKFRKPQKCPFCGGKIFLWWHEKMGN